jgi:hypothetical protein
MLSIPGIKAFLKDTFTQQELMDALVIHFGVVTVWDKIFAIAPGTENNYFPALRTANKRLFFLCRVIFLRSKGISSLRLKKIVVLLLDSICTKQWFYCKTMKRCGIL